MTPDQTDRGAELLRRFNLAVALQDQGQLAQADQLYAQLLQHLPRHPDVLDFYGTLKHQMGDHRGGLELIGRSLALRANAPQTWNRLGSVFKYLHASERAKLSFWRALVLEPALVEGVSNLAGLTLEQGDGEAALALAWRAVKLAPGNSAALVRLGATLRTMERFDEATDYLAKVWRKAPGNAEVALHLSACRAAIGDHQAAVQIARKALVVQPSLYELYASIAAGRDPEEESASYIEVARRAICLSPGNAKLWAGYGLELYRGTKFSAAGLASLRAQCLNPSDFSALTNRASCLVQAFEFGAAKAACQRAVCVSPDDPTILYTLSEAEFPVGELGAAWDLYESRIVRNNFSPRLHLPQLWQGPGDVVERGLLVASEQGVGDEIIFLSCLARVLEAVDGPVVVEVDGRLVGTVQRTYPSVEVVERQLVPGDARGQFFDYQEVVARFNLSHVVFAGSLPGLFYRDRSSPPDYGGYVRVDPQKAEAWRAYFRAQTDKPLVGLSWRSALMTEFRANFHAGLLAWKEMFETTDCAFVNLMHGDTTAEEDALKALTGVELLKPEGLDLWNDLDGLMALMSVLAAVVAGRTANCAFASAVGVPTIRVAPSFLRILDGRDFFFANARPVLDRTSPYIVDDLGLRAGEALRNVLPKVSS